MKKSTLLWLMAMVIPSILIAQPANDSICNALAISLGSNVGDAANLGPIDVTGATAEVGEPNTPVGADPNSCEAQDGWCSSDTVVQNSTWYTFTGTSQGSVSVLAFGFDTQLAVYSGSCTDILAGNGTFIAGNDDIGGGSTASELILSCLNDGETYYILVDGYNGAEGGLELALEVIPSTATLGTYPNTSVIAGQNTTVAPSTLQTQASSLNAFADPGFDGVLTADPATGEVTVTDAVLAGTYTVTVTGPNGCATSSFTLTVTNPSCASYYTSSSVSAGNGPDDIAIGDFNNDGIQDFAITNRFDDDVSIRLGDGNGGFTSVLDVAVGSSPESVAIGDFNGDGIQDFATANRYGGAASIRLGDGNGGFISVPDVSAGSPTSIAVGDFNGDGIEDLAIAAINANIISIRLGDGTGGFTSASNTSTGLSPVSIAIGDFNGDGNQDLAAVNISGNNVSIRLGNGYGAFSAATDVAVGSAPNAIAIGDFNGDGNDDLAITNNYEFDVSIRLGDGLGGFTSLTDVQLAHTPFAIASGDFNGDGLIDLATCGYVNDLSIHIGTGTGGFISGSNINIGAYPTSIAIGDFNGDGIQDLATGNYDGDNVSILLGEVAAISGETEVSVGQNITLVGNGSPDPSTPWTSSNTGVATVNSAGVVAGVAVGTVDITYNTETGCSAVLSLNVIVPSDSVCNALALSFGTNGPFDITGASAEAGEPIINTGDDPNSCQAQNGWCSSDTLIQNSVWFTFEAPLSGNVTVSTAGSTYDTQIAAFGGNDCNDILAGNATFLAANDDMTSGALQSEVKLTCLTPGIVYYVLVDGYNGAEGDTLMIELTEDPLLTTAFSFVDNLGEITFTDQSTDPTITDWLWDFGDGNTSADQNPTHTYGADGTYNACLITTNACGMDTVCQSIAVTTCTSPTADFTGGQQGNQLFFFNNSSGDITSWFWDFGDGNTSTLEEPDNDYGGVIGNYEVCLIATGPCGADTMCNIFNVGCPGDPYATFTTSVISNPGPNQGSIAFNSSGSYGYGANLTYSWDFGDGSTSSSEDPIHLYPATGTYTSCLIVSDACGADTVCEVINISCLPVQTAWTYTVDGLEVSFIDQTTNDPLAWGWFFGDASSPSSDQNPVHTYSQPGIYTACLITTNDCGVLDTVCQMITVGESCANPTIYGVTNIQPGEATISWNSDPNAIKYKLKIRPTGSSSWTYHTIWAPDTFKVKGNLLPSTDYEYKVKTVCGSNSPSSYGAFQYFTTGDVTCSNPTTVTMIGINQTQTNAFWSTVPEAVSYKLKYRPVGTSAWKYKTVYAPETSRNLYNLLPDTEYEYKIRTTCALGSEPYGPTGYFNTLSCPIAGNRTESSIGPNNAILEWDAVPEAVSYKVKYRINNTPTWSYKNITAPTNWTQLNNLTASTTYQWKVKTFCSPGSNYSGYSGNNLFITAAQQGNESARQSSVTDDHGSEDLFVQVYPNPNEGTFTLFLNGYECNVLMNIMDLSGKLIYTDAIQVSDNYSRTMSIDASQGTYTLQLISDQGVDTRRIVIR